jgi:GAF domain-containing protein
MARLAALPGRERSVQDVLSEAVEVRHQTLDLPCEVSVNMGPPQHPAAVATTSQLAQAMDGAQLVTGQGPCVTAFELRGLTFSSDVRGDQRWPALSPHVPDEVLGALAAPVEVGDRLVGALNVYSELLERLESVQGTVDLLAAALGAVFYELELSAELERLGEDMKRALGSRAVIEQAKGIIMVQKKCSADEAFAHLTALSSTHQRKLRDVARDIVYAAAS